MKWFETKWPAVLLVPLSLLFILVVKIRNALYDRGILKSYSVDCFVASVGNLTVGGSGKTPTVQWIARNLASRGHRVAVLSRGYGRSSTGPVLVSDSDRIHVNAQEAGDEPYVLAQTCPGVPVCVDSDRVRGARMLISKFKPTVLLLDDGFQHRRLRRNVDIITVRAKRPWGNGYCLPAGPLREPPSHAKRAHLALCLGNDPNISSRIDKLTIPCIPAVYTPTMLYNANQERPPAFNQCKVLAFCGLGNPKSFQRTLSQLGANIIKFMAYKDHHGYTQTDIQHMEETATKLGATMIVTSEKDWVKLPKSILDDRWFCLQIRLEVVRPDEILSLFENP